MHSNYFFGLKITFHKGFSAKQFSFWNSINLHFLMLMNRDDALHQNEFWTNFLWNLLPKLKILEYLYELIYARWSYEQKD